MGTCQNTVKRLVDRFNQQADQIRSPDYNETLIRIDFINPLMSELGWDMDNRAGYAEQYREVVHEDSIIEPIPIARGADEKRLVALVDKILTPH